MARVYVSIGSNIDREARIREALVNLRRRYGEIMVSPVYESVAVGFDGDNFYNLVVAYDTDEDIQGADETLTHIEAEGGRVRSGPRFSSRTLDLDLLLYDDVVLHTEELTIPRPEILHNAFVLQPLADIAPDLRHPENGQRFDDLWAAFDKESQRLWEVEFRLEA